MMISIIIIHPSIVDPETSQTKSARGREVNDYREISKRIGNLCFVYGVSKVLFLGIVPVD